MNKKKLTSIILVIFLLAILAAATYWYWLSQKNDLLNNQPNIDIIVDDNQSSNVVDSNLNDNQNNNVPTTVVGTDTQLLSNLYYFVERFGTYSNVADFQNIEDLKVIMADDFYNQVIAKQKNLTFAEESTIIYDAYDAKVTNVAWLEKTDDSASARVSTRRHHITADNNDPFQQDIIVRFSKINDQWKVTEAVWQ